MPRPPVCSQPEWLKRAAAALAQFRPELEPDDVAAIVNGQLWEEACDMAPEEAVEVYVTEHPE